MNTSMRLSTAALFTMLAAAALSPVPARAAAYHDAGFYRVIEIAGSDTLNLRSGPNTYSRVVAEIAFDARELMATGRRFAGWVELTYHFGEFRRNDITGWVRGEYVAADDESGDTLFRVAAIGRGEQLEIHRRPGEGSRVIGAIPGTAKHIESRRDCADGWCAIRYGCEAGRYEGYVQQDYLAVESPYDRNAVSDGEDSSGYGSVTTATDGDTFDRRQRWHDFWRHLLRGDRARNASFN